MTVVTLQVVEDDGKKIIIIKMCLCLFVFRSAMTFRGLAFFGFSCKLQLLQAAKRKSPVTWQ